MLVISDRPTKRRLYLLTKSFSCSGAHGMTYIIPRDDGTVVLGGTADKYNL
jgi:hypothetical protein